MAKLTLNNVTNFQNEGSAASTINNNSTATSAALENTLSRDGTSPNQMTADLDMNNKRILNLPDALTNQEPVTLDQMNRSAVRFDITQTLTEPQKQRARDNIGSGSGGGGGGAVTSVFGRSGIVVATTGDYTAAQVTGAAPLASPTFTGIPLSVTPAALDSSTKIATTAFVQGEVALKAPVTSPAFSGIPTAPTAAPGNNSTQIATTAYADLKANIAAPTFTGDAKAVTAAVDDNDTSIATTAYVIGQAGAASPLMNGAAAAGTAIKWSRQDHVHPTDTTKANLASPTFTGIPAAPTAAPATNNTQIATTAYTDAAVAAIGGGTPSAVMPCGRLTLTTAVPVLITSVASATTIYYTPYMGDTIPLYNGTLMVPTTFTELSTTTTDTTKNPNAIGGSENDDWFVWNDAGTIRLSHGPAWTNATTRSAGTALVRVKGIWLNNAAITNGPAASRGTYVGTTRSDASSQLNWIYGTTAAGGGAAFLNVWNIYNQRQVVTRVSDSTDSWSVPAGATRALNSSTGNRAQFVIGLQEQWVTARGAYLSSAWTGGTQHGAALGYDSVTTLSGIATTIFGSNSIPSYFEDTQQPLGFHFFQVLDLSGDTGITTTYGDNGIPGIYQGGMTFSFMA